MSGWTPQDARLLKRCAEALERIAKAQERAHPKPVVRGVCAECSAPMGEHLPDCPTR